ncbi:MULTISPECIES: hypothetical protein [Fischerella]|nr:MULTISPECIES: hypothetical protein [Fischerella]
MDIVSTRDRRNFYRLLLLSISQKLIMAIANHADFYINIRKK